MSAIQQMVWSMGSATAPQIGLDAYTSGLWAAYGLNKVLTYSGPAVRVRRSNDNAEQDIGFSGNSFDSASLASFVGANSAFVTTWYDQTGNSRDMLQATTTRQPRIVDAGVYDGKLVFNPGSTDDFMATSATSSGSVAAKSIFRRVNTRARPGADNIDFCYGNPTLIATPSGANQIQADDVVATGFMTFFLATNSGVGYYNAAYQSEQTGTANGVIILKGQGTPAASFKMYKDGVLETQLSTATVGTVDTSGNFPGYNWTLGYPTAAFCSQIDMWNCALYDADMSADALAINAILDVL